MKYNQQWTSHCADCEEALHQVAHTLLDNMVGNPHNLTLVTFFFVRDLAGYTQRSSVKGGLWNQTIWKRYAEDTCNTSGYAQEKQIPVKTGGLS